MSRPTFWSAVVVIAALAVAGAARGLTPVWSDEFNQPVGSSPDPAKWTFDLGDSGWGNEELEDYTPSPANCSVVADPDATDGKALAIIARKSGDGITSARIKTLGLFSMTYGRFEARLKLPNRSGPSGPTSPNQGMWPAFWLLASDAGAVGWPECGEIDIMENRGSKPALVFGTLHGPGYSGAHGIQGRYTLPDPFGYHVYAVQWAPGSIQWSVDGHVYQTLTPASLPPGRKWVFDHPFFILLNLAVGGKFPKNPNRFTTFPRTFYMDYVRVYNLDPRALAGAPEELRPP